jgi:hypothetical protein
MRLLPVLILVSTAAVAQTTDRFELAVPRHAIKFSPGHLIVNYRPTVEFAYEHRIARQWTLQAEYGRIVNISNTNNEDRIDDAWESDRRGYKAKFEGRYYITANRSGHFTIYTAGELYYNNINYLKQMVTREYYDDAYDALYEKTHRQRVYHEEKGLSGKFGFLVNMGPVVLDINAGLCYRSIHYSKLLPVFEEDEDDFLDFNPDEHSREEPGLILGVRLGYRFPWRLE